MEAKLLCTLFPYTLKPFSPTFKSIKNTATVACL